MKRSYTPAYHPFRFLAVVVLLTMLVMTGIQTSTPVSTRDYRVERTQTKPKCKKKDPNKKCKKGGKGGDGGYAWSSF
jgi:hypothetical protein